MSRWRSALAVIATLVSFATCAQAQIDPFKQHHDLMMSAIAENKADQVQALLKTPYVIINDASYETSYLGQAAVYDRPEIAKILIDAGADVKWHNRSNRSLFHAVAANLRTSSIWSVLIDALKTSTGGVGSPEFRRVINMQATDTTTAIYVAVDRGSVDPQSESKAIFGLKQLIEKAGADPNIPFTTHAGASSTPLALARYRHSGAMVTYLQQHGGQ